LIEITTSILIILGIIFLMAGSLGVVRMPDFYGRMHAAGKASTLGVTFCGLAALAYFSLSQGHLHTKLLLITLFIFLTSPVASHMMSRAAYMTRVPMWEGTIMDEMKGKIKGGPGGKQDKPKAKTQGK